MLSWAVVLGLLARQILAIPTISAKGSKLFTSDGAQFYIKGGQCPHQRGDEWAS